MAVALGPSRAAARPTFLGFSSPSTLESAGSSRRGSHPTWWFLTRAAVVADACSRQETCGTSRIVPTARPFGPGDRVPLRAVACPACQLCSKLAASLGFHPPESDRPSRRPMPSSMSPSSAGLPFFALAVAARRNVRRTRCRMRGVLPCGLRAGQHGPDPRAASLAAGPFPLADPHGSAVGRRSTNFRLGFKRVPLQAWLASQRLPADGVPDAVRGPCGAPASTDPAGFLAEGLLDWSPSMPLPDVALLAQSWGKLEFKGFSCGRRFVPVAR